MTSIQKTKVTRGTAWAAYRSVGAAIVLALGLAQPGYSQSRMQLDLPLYPQVTDYSASCAGVAVLNHDPYGLSTWNGQNLDIAVDSLLEVASLYASGRGNVQADPQLALRLYQHLSERPSPQQNRAKYQAGVLLLDLQGSPESDRRAAQMLTEAANARVTGAARELAILYEIGRGLPQDFELAARFYRIAAAEGDAESAFALSRLYGEGLINADSADAAENMAKLGLITLLNDVNQGRCSALITVAKLYETGDLITRNEQAATAWYEAAAKTGNARAMAAIARRYYAGIGVESNVQMALDWWLQAAERGSTEAKANIGMLYANGDGVQANEGEAIRWLTEAAEGGNVNAMVHLASLYRGELSALPMTKADPVQAYAWTERAYNTDPTKVSVIMNLARALVRGEGAAPDPERAFALFNEAMRFGNRSALREMAQAYLAGSGVDRDAHRALQVFRQAASRGDLASYAVIADMYRCGIGVDPNSAMADLWQERAASLGDIDSLITLSNRNIFEQEVEDKERALQLLLRAASNNSREAMIRLHEIFMNGSGIDPDPEAAERWKTLAIRPGVGQDEGLYLLAEAYRTNTAYEWDPIRVEQLLTEAHEMGNIKATVRLGKYHIRPGEDGMDNIEYGVELLRHAAKLGRASAMRELAIYYRAQGNLTEAIGWLDAAIVDGLDTALILKAEWAIEGVLSGQPEPGIAREILDDVINRNICTMNLSSAVVENLARGTGGPGREAEALALADRAVDAFRPTADEMATLGLALLEGRQDQSLASRGIELLEKSIDRGSIRGLVRMAEMYLEGRGVPVNFELAMDLLNRAGDAGDESALLYIGRAKLEGIGGAPDYEGAWRAMEQAAAAGIPEAYREMGHWYLRGLGREQNADVGLGLLERASSMGDTQAMLDLANIYSVGFVAEARQDVAVQWLERAASSGNNEAMHRLGLAYLLGLGVQKNENEAQRWFRLSGNTGYSLIKPRATEILE
jgi:TPR repeat protein